jgi:hypothetical protein
MAVIDFSFMFNKMNDFILVQGGEQGQGGLQGQGKKSDIQSGV